MAVHTNFLSMGVALKQYGSVTLPEVQRGRMTIVALQVMKSLTELTPVDQGRLKGNWQMTTGQPAEGEIDRLDPSKEGTPGLVAQADVLQRLPGWKPGDWLWFHNGLPYAVVINDGTETRPAHHMVEITAAQIERWLAEQS